MAIISFFVQIDFGNFFVPRNSEIFLYTKTSNWQRDATCLAFDACLKPLAHRDRETPRLRFSLPPNGAISKTSVCFLGCDEACSIACGINKTSSRSKSGRPDLLAERGCITLIQFAATSPSRRPSEPPAMKLNSKQGKAAFPQGNTAKGFSKDLFLNANYSHGAIRRQVS